MPRASALSLIPFVRGTFLAETPVAGRTISRDGIPRRSEVDGGTRRGY
jgi:hypothetical protein